MEETQKPSVKKNPPYVMIGVIVVALLILGGVMFMMTSKSSPDKKTGTQEGLSNTEAIPTVDSSVKVSVEGVNGTKELQITVTNVPSGTSGVESEFSYETAEGGLQGGQGQLSAASGNKKFEKKFTLGTCSSGVCTYHHVKGPIKVSLKFTGSYGERIFDKEYTI